MALAVAVLRADGVSVTEPTSARSTTLGAGAHGRPGRGRRGDAAVRDELDLVGAGTLGVLCPRAPVDPVTAAVGADRPAVAVLTVAQAKGLEFDGVLLLEPAGIVADSPRGMNDLYVAITRPTQRLHVLHAEPLPAGFEEA